MKRSENIVTLQANSDQETRDAGRRLGLLIRNVHRTRTLKNPIKGSLGTNTASASRISIALYGELGAGKTTFVQGFARGLGVPEEYYITSPTYNIINEYPTESYADPTENSAEPPESSAIPTELSTNITKKTTNTTESSINGVKSASQGNKEPIRENLTLYHMDLYRLGSQDELEQIGFDDIVASEQSVIIIEWPDIIDENTLKFDMVIEISTDRNFNREISFIPSGLDATNLLKQFAI